MSGTATPAGLTGNLTSQGHGGGFWQSPDAFSGLTNTDLRRRRRRRRIALLNTTWLTAGRREGVKMRKNEVTDLVGTLEKSMVEIAASSTDDRDGLIHQSVSEFQGALLEKLEQILPAQPEVLEKGLNHIAAFANTLRDAARTIEALKTGRPSYIVSSDGQEPETLPMHVIDQLDRFIQVGVMTLRSMVNDTADLPEDEDDLERAEKAGQLAKIETPDGGEMLIKTALPESFHGYFSDPVDMVMDYAQLARDFRDQAVEIAEDLHKADSLPVDLIAGEYPELFEPMGKALDENVGDGGDPNAAADPGSDADITDDVPHNPIEIIVRLASAIVVIGGSQLQQQPEDGMDDGTTTGMPDDTAGGTPLQRQAPAFDANLEKILKGEVEVDPTVADALEELIALRVEKATLAKRQGQQETELQKLKDTVARLSQQPAAPKGSLFAISKSEDTQMPHGPDADAQAKKISDLSKTNPDAAARELLKVVQAGGGRPVLPPH